MSGLPWGKFFWKDWLTDPALSVCSLAAQGLWMRMLCIMSMSEPPGHLTLPPSSRKESEAKQVARMCHADARQVRPLLNDLEMRGYSPAIMMGTSSPDAWSKTPNFRRKAAATRRKDGKSAMGNPMADPMGHPMVNPMARKRQTQWATQCLEQIQKQTPPLSAPVVLDPERVRLGRHCGRGSLMAISARSNDHPLPPCANGRSHSASSRRAT